VQGRTCRLEAPFRSRAQATVQRGAHRDPLQRWHHHRSVLSARAIVQVDPRARRLRQRQISQISRRVVDRFLAGRRKAGPPTGCRAIITQPGLLVLSCNPGLRHQAQICPWRSGRHGSISHATGPGTVSAPFRLLSRGANTLHHPPPSVHTQGSPEAPPWPRQAATTELEPPAGPRVNDTRPSPVVGIAAACCDRPSGCQRRDLGHWKKTGRWAKLQDLPATEEHTLNPVGPLTRFVPFTRSEKDRIGSRCCTILAQGVAPRRFVGFCQASPKRVGRVCRP